MRPKHAVIYVRVSTAEQASNNQSLPVQEAKATAYCKQRALPVLKVFSDKGESARTDDRPQFRRMLDFCREHRQDVSHVVVADLSRFARNIFDQTSTIIELKKLGIEFVSVDEPNLDETAAGKLLKNVLGSMHQFFSDSLSEKTRFRMQAGVKQGRWLWKAPLGYKNSETKTVVTDPERAPLVRKVFDAIAGGMSVGDAMRQVTALGLTTRTNNKVPKQTFSRMVRNPFYCGWIESDGTRVRGNHEPIVSEELFDAVQQRLTGKSPHQIEHDDFPLRGFVRCSSCDRNLTAGFVKGRSKRYAKYWCWTKGCHKVNVSAELLEARFWQVLFILQPTAALLEKMPTLAARQWEVRKETVAADARALTRRLDEQATLNHKAIKARLNGELSEEDFKSFKAGIDDETAKIREQIRALDSERSSMEELAKETEREVIDLSRSWRAAPGRRKRELQHALFPEGLTFSMEREFFTPHNYEVYLAYIDLLIQMVNLGVPDGI